MKSTPLKKAKKKLLHGKLEKSTFNFEVPGETIIAVHNALAFAAAHSDEYNDEIPSCPHCIEAINAVRRQLAHILEYSDIYIRKDNNLN